MKRDTPQQWVPVLETKRLHSARDLARELGVSPNTVTRLFHGEATSDEMIEATARHLGITPAEVRRLRGDPTRRPFRLPSDADRLTQRQRAAILAVIRAMLEPDHAPPMTDDVEQERNDLASEAHVIATREKASKTDAERQTRQLPSA